MTDREIKNLATQFAAAVSGPLSAMIQEMHAPLVDAIKRRNKGMSKKQFSAVFTSGSLFGNNDRSDNHNQQL
jgi:hypothetical protein